MVTPRSREGEGDLPGSLNELAAQLRTQDDTLRELNDNLQRMQEEYNQLYSLLQTHRAEGGTVGGVETGPATSVYQDAHAAAQAALRMDMLQDMAQRELAALRSRRNQIDQEAAARWAEVAPPAAPTYSSETNPAAAGVSLPAPMSLQEIEAAARAKGQAIRDAHRDQVEMARAKAQDDLAAKKVQQESQRDETRARSLGRQFERQVEADERQQAREAARQQAANVAMAERAHAEQMTYLPSTGAQQMFSRGLAEQQRDQTALAAADMSRARLRANYFESPQGQQQLQQQAEAQRLASLHREREERAKQIAEMGRLNYVLLETRDRLTAFGGIALKAGGGMMALAAVASPNSFATLTGSGRLLMASAGRAFVPVMEAASDLMQRLYGWNRGVMARTGVNPLGIGAASALGFRFGGAPGALAAGGLMALSTEGQTAGAAAARIGGGTAAGAAIGSVIPGVGTGIGAGIGFAVSSLRELAGWIDAQTPQANARMRAFMTAMAPPGLIPGESTEDKRAALQQRLMRSYEGLPRGGVTTVESYLEQGQAAVLAQSPLEQQIFRDQVDVLNEILGQLKQLNTRDGQPPPFWR